MHDFENIEPISVFRRLYSPNHSGKVANPQCGECSCLRTTREGKRFCSEHVELGDYVKTIVLELQKRDKESRLLESGETIDIKGHLVKETLLMLRHGSYTDAKLARLMDISHRAAACLISQMAECGLAQKGLTDRGVLTIYKLPMSRRAKSKRSK